MPRLALLSTLWIVCWTTASGLSAAEAAPQGGGQDGGTKKGPNGEQIEFFEKQIRPLLTAHCLECHGAKKAEAGLRLDTHAGLLRGIEGVPVVTPGDPDKSRLVQVARYDGNVQMPPDGKMPEKQFAALVAWVKMGAPWPADKSTAANVASSESLDPAARVAAARAAHWAFQPIRRPPTPDVADDALCRTSFDRHWLRELETAGVAPSAAADRRTWLRRASFDLTGLPPSFDELEEFARSEAPDAQARAVDRLLASPHYGERWGRHWLDIARYADTKGYVLNQERRFPYAYTYRDYVVQSFNDDLPFDQFVREQLAADLLPASEDNRALAALGFLTVGRRFNNIHDDADDRIDVVTRGLLGLTVTCARCHDHKFEAVPSEDYYSLYGVFRSTIEPAELPLVGRPRETAEYAAFQAELARREKAHADALAEEAAKIPERLRTQVGDWLAQVIVEKRGAAAAGDYPFGKRELRAPMVARWKDQLAKSAGKPHAVWGPWHRFDKAADGDGFAAEAAKIVASLGDASAATPINRLVRDGFVRETPRAMIDVARVYGGLFESVRRQWTAAIDAAKKEKRPPPAALDDAAAEELRLLLYAPDSAPMVDAAQARALFDVAANNRIKGLASKIEQLKASSPGAPPRAMVLNDAPRPFEPAVFVRGNPDRPGKKIPRQFLAVLSDSTRTPFQKGSGRLELAEAIVDRDNPLTARVFVNRVWQHRFGAGLVRTPSNFGERGEAPTHPRLLDALAARFLEDDLSIKRLHRETMLSAVYGQTSRTQPRGLEVDPENRLLWRMNRKRLEFEPARDAMLWASGQLDRRIGGRPIDITAAPTQPRRTLYGAIDRQDLPGVFRTFDFASPDVSTELRPETTVPQQALFVMNSPFLAEQSQRLWRRAASDVGGANDDETQIVRLYEYSLARRPDADELRFARQFLQGTTDEPTARGAWQYGYGEIDLATGKLVAFSPFGHWTGKLWQVGPAMPDPKLGYLQLRSGGGHPGNDARQASVLRWTAPLDGAVSLAGELQHPNEQGDGVRAHLVSSRDGRLAVWEAQHGKRATEAARIEVRRGDTLDFVVDARGGHSFDSYQWTPKLRQIEPAGGAVWDSVAEFRGPPGDSLKRGELLAQILLLTNEFTFVD